MTAFQPETKISLNVPSSLTPPPAQVNENFQKFNNSINLIVYVVLGTQTLSLDCTLTCKLTNNIAFKHQNYFPEIRGTSQGGFWGPRR